MRSAATWLLLAALGAVLSGCEFQMTETPKLENGWMTYVGDATTVFGTCGVLPILLTGNDTSTRLSGACRQVAVTGDHNTVTLGLEPGARVEVLGAHNYIWWYMRRPGPRPTLIDHGAANTIQAMG